MEYHQLVLPQRYHHKVLTALHDHIGHQGIDQMLDLLREWVYWPSMAKDAQNWVTIIVKSHGVTITSPNQKSVIWRHTILWTWSVKISVRSICLKQERKMFLSSLMHLLSLALWCALPIKQQKR